MNSENSSLHADPLEELEPVQLELPLVLLLPEEELARLGHGRRDGGERGRLARRLPRRRKRGRRVRGHDLRSLALPRSLLQGITGYAKGTHI